MIFFFEFINKNEIIRTRQNNKKKKINDKGIKKYAKDLIKKYMNSYCNQTINENTYMIDVVIAKMMS